MWGVQTMKVLSIVGLALLLSGLLTSPALPLSYEIDVGQDGSFETGGSFPICVWLSKSIDIYVDGYTCPPNDTLFGVQVYISTDPTASTVTNCTPNIAGGCHT